MAQDPKKLDVLKTRLTQLCEEALRALGYDLVALDYLRDPQGWVLRVYIDTESDGPAGAAPAPSSITHEDCERASRHLGTVLDVEDPIDVAYRLEVSSPGVKRPLRREADFVRFCGQQARVQLVEPIGGRKNFTGRILSATDGVVDLDVDGNAVQLPIAQMRKARLEVDL